jgi:exopolysaccharide biosynthesis predicted pyruvyltransferase EpsI
MHNNDKRKIVFEFHPLNFVVLPKAVFYSLSLQKNVCKNYNFFKETKNVMSNKNNYYYDYRWLLKNWEG